MAYPLQRLSVRKQVLLLALVIVFPVAAMLAWFLGVEVRHAREAAQDKVRLLAESSAMRLSLTLGGYQEILRRMAERPRVRALDPGNFDTVIAEVVRLHPEFNNLGVRRRDGSPVFTFLPNASPAPQMREQPWFREGLQNEKFTAGNAFSGRLSGRWVTVLTHPVRDDGGRVAGLINTPVDLLRLSRLVFQGIPENSVAEVIDRQGVTLLRSREAEQFIGKPSHPQAEKAVEGRSEGHLSYAGVDGVQMLYFFKQIPGVDWRIVAGVPEREIFAEYYATLWRSLAIGAGVMLLVLALAWRISATIVRPMRDLASAVARVAAGDEGVRAGVDGPAEIGAVAHQFNAMLDARDRGDAALRESEVRTRRLLAASDVGLWDWDLVSGEVYFSREWKRQLGYDEHELPDRFDEWQARLHPGDHEWLLKRIADYREGRVAAYDAEVRMRHRDGSWRWILSRADFVRNAAGEPVRMMGSHIDITGRKQSEEALAASEQRFRDLLQNIPSVAVQGYNFQGVTQYWNLASEKLYGYSAAEAVGKSLLELIVPAEMHEGMREAMRHMAQTGEVIPAAELSLRCKDGSRVLVYSSHALVQVPGGEPEMFCIDLDLTARREAEAARELLEAQLRESQKMEAVGTLAGGVAHDFNSIIATILGNAELAREDAKANPVALQSIDEIRKAGSRARDLVQQILSFSRRQPTERKRIALAPVLEESARLLRATLPARLTLQVHCAADVPPVLADMTQVQQVVINLATNAMQAMRSGPGAISMRLDTVLLNGVLAGTSAQLQALHARCPGRTVRLVVRDTGAGMDAATLSRIFEPFFTTKAVDEGTGLGLSVVLGIVQTHEGAIVVESEPGRGTIFSIYLPVAAGAPAPAGDAAPPQPDAEAPASGLHLLYIDDDESLVFLVKRLLERRGYRISGFTDQRLALEALRADPAAFDLVLTDYNMPGMSGLDVAREVRALRADLPVAIASGFIDETLREQAGGAGVRELIFKATEVAEFCAAVQRVTLATATASGPQ